MSNWIKADKNYFTLDGNKNSTISFRLFVPPLTKVGNYSGSLYILRLP